jgi:hypothetical protein
VSYIEFGQSTTELLLLVRFWDEQPDHQALLLTARDNLVRFQAACREVELAEECRQRVESVKVSDLDRPEQRALVAGLVMQCLSVYDMEPPGSGQPKETE